MKFLGAACLLVFALGVGGCAMDPPAKPGVTETPKPRAAAPRYNLTGYSQPFKDGYGDACTTPRKRNEQRFKNDTDYQMGWQDGSSVCRTR